MSNKNCFKPFDSKNLLKDHLLLDHIEELHNIQEMKWSESDLYHCKTCTNCIFTCKGSLTRHTNTYHNRTITSNKTNIERLIEFIPVPPTSTHIWNNTIAWLQNLNITPPPFRQSIWLKTNKGTKTKIISLYHRLLLALINTPNTATTTPNIPSLHNIEVVWKLVFIFESIILFPIKHTSNQTNTTPTLEKRFHLFRTGNVKKLYEESRNITSLSHLEKNSNTTI